MWSRSCISFCQLFVLICVAQSLVFFVVMHHLSAIICLFHLMLFDFVLSVLQFTPSGYQFGIFKLFITYNIAKCELNYIREECINSTDVAPNLKCFGDYDRFWNRVMTRKKIFIMFVVDYPELWQCSNYIIVTMLLV